MTDFGSFMLLDQKPTMDPTENPEFKIPVIEEKSPFQLFTGEIDDIRIRICDIAIGKPFYNELQPEKDYFWVVRNLSDVIHEIDKINQNAKLIKFDCCNKQDLAKIIHDYVKHPDPPVYYLEDNGKKDRYRFLVTGRIVDLTFSLAIRTIVIMEKCQ